MRAVVILLTLICAQPVWALSCLHFGPRDAYIEARDAPERYVVVTGTLRFDEKKLPKADPTHQHAPRNTRIPARFAGKALARGGFTQPFAQNITLEVDCYGPWCASAQSGQTYLAFLAQSDNGYQLSVNPCGGFAFAKPVPKVLRQMRTCFNGGLCPPTRR
ncbi:MAG: hypothetical protein AB8B51_11830 [Sedimentitalea sp.]